jgi:3-methyladenine DNA glycosylase AlkD
MENRRRRPPQPSGPTPLDVDQQAVDTIVEEIRARLAKAGRKDQADALKRAYGDNVPCYGIKPADLHTIGMDYVRRLRSPGYAASLAVADSLFTTGNLEEGLIGAQLVGANARHIGGSDFERFDLWAAKLTNPQTANALGTQCISRAMSGKPSIALRLLEWAKSGSVPKRIAAVSSFSPLVREGRFMTDALTVAEPLMTNESEDVQNAVGTMLMEMTRLQAPRVVEFLGPWKGKGPKIIMELAADKLIGDDRAAVLG